MELANFGFYTSPSAKAGVVDPSSRSFVAHASITPARKPVGVKAHTPMDECTPRFNVADDDASGDTSHFADTFRDTSSHPVRQNPTAPSSFSFSICFVPPAVFRRRALAYVREKYSFFLAHCIAR